MVLPDVIEQPQASQTHVLGIDIAKDTLSICLIDGTNRQTTQSPIDSMDPVENRRRGYRSVERCLRRHKVSSQSVAVVMEATGVYWEACAHFFHEEGYAVYVVNPARTGRFGHLSPGRQDRCPRRGDDRPIRSVDADAFLGASRVPVS